jgi:hypothetical protein
MFAQQKTKWHYALVRAVLALVPTPVHTSVNAARKSAYATYNQVE